MFLAESMGNTRKELNNLRVRAIQNLLNIEPDDKVKAYINILNLKDEEYINNNYIVLCYETRYYEENNTWRPTHVPEQNGVNAITIKDGRSIAGCKNDQW